MPDQLPYCKALEGIAEAMAHAARLLERTLAPGRRRGAGGSGGHQGRQSGTREMSEEDDSDEGWK